GRPKDPVARLRTRRWPLRQLTRCQSVWLMVLFADVAVCIELFPSCLHSVACMVLPQGARLDQPFRALPLTKPQRAFTGVHPSSLSLAWLGGVVPPRLGRSAQLRTPPLPATHVGSGNRSWTLTW